MPKATSNVSSGKAVQFVPRVETKRPVYKDELVQALQEVIDTGGLTTIGTGGGGSGLTQTQVNALITTAINAIVFPESALAKSTATALTGKANPTQAELNTAVGKFLTATALAPYATTASVTAALAPYATTAALTTALNGYVKTADLAPYATTAALNAALAGYVKPTDLTTALAPYATTTAVTNQLKGYVTPTDLDAWGDRVVGPLAQQLVDLDGNFAQVNDLQAVMDAITGTPGSTTDTIAAFISTLSTGGGEGGGLTAEQAQQVAEAITLAQGVVNVLSGKPQGGGTLADVAAVFGDLGATFQAQIEQAINALEIPDAIDPAFLLQVVETSVNLQALIDSIVGQSDATPAQVLQMFIELNARLETSDLDIANNAQAIAEIKEDFAQIGPALFEAIQSGMKALPSRITLNVESTLDNDRVVIEAHQLKPPPNPPTDERAVDIDLEPYKNGVLRVKGKRVLTTDDVLEVAGGAIDQVALEAAVEAATADLRAELADLKKKHQDLLDAITYKIGADSTDVAGMNFPLIIQHLFNSVPDNQQVQAALDQKADKTEMAVALSNKVDNDYFQDLYGTTHSLAEATKWELQRTWNALGGKDWGDQTAEWDGTLADVDAFVKTSGKASTNIQGLLDAMASKKNATLADAVSGFVQAMPEALQDLDQRYNQLCNEIVEYMVTTYPEKVELEKLEATVLAIMQALGGSTPQELNEVYSTLNETIGLAITEGINEKVPEILQALSLHLENVLAIFNSGGTTGVTPTQLTELAAEIARVYATKEALTAELKKYAKLDDDGQEITAALVTTRGVRFSINDEVLVPIDFPDYGTRMSVIPRTAVSTDDAGIVVLHTDLEDLISGAGNA